MHETIGLGRFAMASATPNVFRVISFRDQAEEGDVIPTQEVCLSPKDARVLRDFLNRVYPNEEEAGR